VLPLGTGNDLAQILGWSSSFDDDARLPDVLEQLERAQIRMLDRWVFFLVTLAKTQRQGHIYRHKPHTAASLALYGTD